MVGNNGINNAAAAGKATGPSIQGISANATKGLDALKVASALPGNSQSAKVGDQALDAAKLLVG
jgi:hypothetical protein